MTSQSARTRRSSPFGLGLILTGLLAPPLVAQGAVEGWGVDPYDLLVPPTNTTGYVQLATNSMDLRAVVLRPDGTIDSWGSSHSGVLWNIPTEAGHTMVASGGNFSLALRSDGSIAAWGASGNLGWNFGQVDNAPTGPNFIDIAAGSSHGLALRADGSIAAWGWDSDGQVSGAPLGTGYRQVAASLVSSFAIRSDRSIAGWGEDSNGIISGIPSGGGFEQISVGGYLTYFGNHALALRTDGSIVGWGSDFFGQASGAPTGNDFIQVSAGFTHSLALRSNGTIVAWGNPTATGAPTGSGYTSIAASYDYSMALRESNSGQPFCGGSAAHCPCAAGGLPGEGCQNSTGSGAALSPFGTAYLDSDSFGLEVSGVPGNKPGLILRGASQTNGGLGAHVGDGLLCVSGQTARSQIQITSNGSTTFTDFNGAPFSASTYGPGNAANYQFWYRDPANACTGSGFNFSAAWTVTWMP